MYMLNNNQYIYSSSPIDLCLESQINKARMGPVKCFKLYIKIIHISYISGLCMFLRKRDSFIDAYNCRNFVEGCPNSTYRMYEVYKCK